MGEAGPATGAETEGPPRPVGPPVGLLAAAAVSVAASLAMFPVTLLPFHVVGYLLASFVTISLVALYRASVQRRRRNPYYSPRPALRRGATLLLVLGTVVAGVHVWVIATHLAS